MPKKKAILIVVILLVLTFIILQIIHVFWIITGVSLNTHTKYFSGLPVYGGIIYDCKGVDIPLSCSNTNISSSCDYFCLGKLNHYP